jgi:hypothetical protein
MELRKTQEGITTVTFSMKQESSPALSYATPATPSVIRDAVELAKDVELLATQQSLHGSSSSIHNTANHMAIDPENLVPADVFTPGIPLPPTNISLPPAMSRTLQFGRAEAHEDGVAPSLTPEIDPHAAFWTKMESQMNKFVQPIWDMIHRIESSMQDRIPRIPPHAGPGYCSEHIHYQAPKVSSAAIAPRLTNQGTRLQDNTVDATPFPSETLIPRALEVLIARVDDKEFLQLSQASRGTRRRNKARIAAIEARQSVPGATGPADDNRYIQMTSNNSRIRPMFANIVTQMAVTQQQTVQHSAAQARAVQGHKPAGNQGARMAANDGNLTEVTVVHFGGLENAEEERKFRARNPVAIVQAVQRDLSKRTKNPPAVLSSRWSTTSQTMGNFVYTLAGIIPLHNLLALKPYLCSLFTGHTELVPTKGWTWIQLRQVPTEDEDGCVWGPDDLLKQFIANPCFQNALICIAPHWQGNPLNNDKEFSTVLAAIIDKDNAICQNALTHRVRMFGAQVRFLRCRDNPMLQQCSRCHLLGHYANSSRCKQPKNTFKCYRCRGPHNGREHNYECNAKSHKTLGKCDCILKCLLCKKRDHHARSRKCSKRGDFQLPRLPK